MGKKNKTISKLRKRFRSGNLLSRILREVFEKKLVRSVVGAQLFAGVILFGPLASDFSFDTHPEGLAYPGMGISEVVLELPTDPIIETESVQLQNPTAGFKGISTRFVAGHAGYDLRAYLGSDVYPVAAGVVEQIVHSNYGYGRRVIVKHENGMESLYAHMGLIAVEEGDEVDLTTKLGEVGMTGRTTGPHIHLELYVDGVPVNPGYYLDLDNIPTSQQ